MVVIAIGRAGTTESNRALHLYRYFQTRGTYERGCILERISDTDIETRCFPQRRTTTFPSVVRSFREKKRGREKRNAVTGRSVICVRKGKRWKERSRYLGVTESAKYNPERLEVMIDRWRIEGSCPATFLRVPSQGHSTPWNPEPAWNRAVVAELFRSLAAVASGEKESSQRYGAQKRKRAYVERERI